eukprot:5305142-Prymnesium_polylepis.1
MLLTLCTLHRVTPPLTAADIVGDQISGRSTADAYRRQLLQACRHVELDCWDGADKPVVTHVPLL